MDNLSFKGLPQHLHKRQICGLNVKDLKSIIVDAGMMAKRPINTTERDVFTSNSKIFNKSKVISEKGADLLKEEYGAKTARELRDALAKSYKNYKGDGILDMIV